MYGIIRHFINRKINRELIFVFDSYLTFIWYGDFIHGGATSESYVLSDKMTKGGSKVLIVFKTTKRGYKDIGTVKIKNEKYQFDVLLP